MFHSIRIFLPQDEIQYPFASLLYYLETEISFDKLILSWQLKKKLKDVENALFGVPLLTNSFDNCCFKNLTPHSSNLLILENMQNREKIFF